MTSLLAGIGVGIGVVMVWLGLCPPRPPLAAALAAIDPPRPDHANPAEPYGFLARLGQPFVPLLRSAGLPRPSRRADLAICGRTAESQLGEQAAAALVGALLPPAIAGLSALVGVTLPWPMPTWASLACVIAGIFIPELVLRERAGKLRADVTYALSSLLDVTVITLAGGAGVEQAITDAAAAGHGWAHARIRHAITAARLTRRPIWHALDDLGTELGVPAFTELGASMRLAGEEGARIRRSLAARATGLRLNQLHATEAAASQATERMSLPVVLMLLGFLLLIGFPALHAVLTSL